MYLENIYEPVEGRVPIYALVHLSTCPGVDSACRSDVPKMKSRLNQLSAFS
jgi:hypothetical protein